MLSPLYLKGRSIYLDGDTLVLSDLGDLLRHDLQGQPIGAVQDMWWLSNHMKARSRRYPGSGRSRNRLGEQEVNVPSFRADRYFNGGILLLDFDVIASAGLVEAMGDIEAASGYNTHNQDHLNTVFAGRVCWLPPAWNAQWSNIITRHRYFDEQTRAKFAESRRTPKIIHYAARYDGKPWENLRQMSLKRLLVYGVANMVRMRARYAKWRGRAADFFGCDPFEKA